MSLVDDLKSKESTLRGLQEEKANFTGQFEQLKSDLKAKFKIDSIEAAQTLLTEKNRKLAALTKEGDAVLAKITAAIEKAKAKNDNN